VSAPSLLGREDPCPHGPRLAGPVRGWSAEPAPAPSHSNARAALPDSARRAGDGRPTRPRDRRGARTGFGDPDFLELCGLVQQVLRPQSRPAERLLGALRALPRAARLIRAVRRLPSRRIHVTDTPAGAAIRDFFGWRLLQGRHLVAISTLALPADPAEYARGRSRQALRTNCTRAQRMGIRVELVDDPARVRERMTDLFAQRRDADAGAWYFSRAAVREGEFWFATDADGRVIAVTEIIPDREAALLRSMISAPGPGRSEARYLLMSEVMSSLAGRGVRHVLVGRALRLPPGLVYFQRLLGFTPMNPTLVQGRG
jgi:hypothetical protein